MNQIESRDLLRFRFLSNVAYSPDGRNAAFLEHRPDEEKNRYAGRLWLYAGDSGETRPLTAGDDAANFIWLDNDSLLFASKREKPKPDTTQFFRLDLRGGEAEPHFTVPHRVTFIRRIDSDHYVLLCAVDTQTEEKRENRAEAGKDFHIFDEIPFWSDGRGITNKKRSTLMLFDAATGACTRVSPEHTDVTAVRLSQNGEKILYAGKDYADVRPRMSGLYEYEIPKGQTRTLVEPGELEIDTLAITARHIFFAGSDEAFPGKNPRLYLIDQQTGERTMLPDYDFEPGAGVGTDSAFGGGRTHKYSVGKVYMLSVDRVTSRLISIDGKGDRQVYTKKDGGIQCFDIFGKSVLFIGMRDGRLPELYSLDLASGEEKRLTSFNEEWYQQHKPQTPEHFLFRNRDGLELDGFVLYPAGFEPGKKYPAVLQIHGGPKGVYGTTYFHEMQVLASHGMFVIFTNPRGGDGRGSAFADLTRKLGTIDYEDLLDFTDAALARIPEIDGARVGICGGSYGGFMVNWMIGHTDRYAAACSQRSIANYMSKCLTTDIGFTHNLAQMGTNPWDGFDVMWGTSPLRYAHNAKTPTLFIHSDNDYRCWMSEGLQMFTALKMQGVKTRLALYHGESHGLSRTGSPRNRLARLDEIVSWFEQNL